MKTVILFLDFDGVLHPDEVYRYPGKGIVLKTACLPVECENLELFCYMPALEKVLADFPLVKIVLSTSWVKEIGFDRTSKRLSPALRERVIGATFHSRHTPDWNRMTRYSQIVEHVERHHLGRRWIAVDDDDCGWPRSMSDRLVATDVYEGIAAPAALADLRAKLERLC